MSKNIANKNSLTKDNYFLTKIYSHTRAARKYMKYMFEIFKKLNFFLSYVKINIG